MVYNPVDEVKTDYKSRLCWETLSKVFYCVTHLVVDFTQVSILM